MGSVYSARFFMDSYAVPVNNQDVATVPDGYVWQLRTATARVGGAASPTTFSLYIVSGAARGSVLSAENMTAHQYIAFNGRAVLYPGDTLRLQILGGSGAVWVMASGYSLYQGP